MAARAHGFSCLALRLCNVYGPHQPLGGPYAGVLAIFAARLLRGRPPFLFEDGRQRRDFVSVRDVAQAFRLALENTDVGGQALNVGSGRATSLKELAQTLASALGGTGLDPVTTGTYRAGDIRHCFADISAARVYLGYRPEVSLEAGLLELSAWLDGRALADRSGGARPEPEPPGLT
jgi:dTDP-L-rhamnose 4-epimerase